MTTEMNPALESYPLESRVESIWIDFHMLRDGQWRPDSDSVAACIENMEVIFRELKRLGVIPQNHQMEYHDNDSDFVVVVD